MVRLTLVVIVSPDGRLTVVVVVAAIGGGVMSMGGPRRVVLRG